MEALTKEGYDIYHGLGGTTRVWIYNCQHAGGELLRAWGCGFKRGLVLMQGTKRGYDANKGDRSIQHGSTDT